MVRANEARKDALARLGWGGAPHSGNYASRCTETRMWMGIVTPARGRVSLLRETPG